MARSNGNGYSSALLLVAFAIVISALYLMREVLLPLALAALLAFLLTPVVEWLERHHVGRVPAVLLVVVLSFAILGFTARIVAGQLLDLAKKLPDYQGNINTKIERIQHSFSGLAKPTRVLRQLTGIGGLPPPATAPAPPPPHAPESERPLAQRIAIELARLSASNPIHVTSHQPPPTPLEFLRDNLSAILAPLAMAFIVVVFVIFMLLQRDDLRDRMIRLFSRGRITVTTQAINDAAERISRYLLMQAIVNTCYGVPIAVGLYFIGVPNAFLWGLLATLLRFLPYIGLWIAAGLPILLSFAVFDGYGHLLLTAGLYTTVELTVYNAVEPWLYGHSTGISPTAIIVAAVFWTWLWGPIGLLLSTPLTVALVVAGRYVPQLHFLDVLLGDEPVISPQLRLYQRLLAYDRDAVEEAIEEALKTRPPIEVYDNLLLPALAFAEQDRHRGQVDEAREQFIRQTLKELIEDVGERSSTPDTRAEAAGEASERPQEHVPVLCLPARDEADELAAMMLAQVLQGSGVNARYVPVAALASEMLDIVGRHRPRIVCISALPPSAQSHARYLCKRLLAKPGESLLIIGLWTVKPESKPIASRLACRETDRIVTTLRDAAAQIGALDVARASRPMPSTLDCP